MTLNTVSGAIMVRLPENTQADVAVRSTSGRLVSSFDEVSQSSGPARDR